MPGSEQAPSEGGRGSGIYRGEVIEIMGAVADIRIDVRRILWYMEGGEDDEWEAEEEEDPPGDA